MTTGVTTPFCAGRSPTSGATCGGASLVLTLLLALSAHAAPDDGVCWRQPRHDLQQTRASPGKAKLASAPVPRWRAFLGGRPLGTLALDVDLDGDDDLLTLESGAVVARRANGTVLWRSAAMAASAFAGQPRLVGGAMATTLPLALRVGVAVRTAGGVAVLHPLNGDQLFVTPSGALANPILLRFADADGDGIDELFAAENGGFVTSIDGAVRIFPLSGAAPLVLPALDPSGLPASGALVDVVDADGDGDADVVGGHQGAGGTAVVFVYDGRDAKVLATSAAGEGQSCGGVSAVAAGNPPAPLLVCAADLGPNAGDWAVRGVSVYRKQGAALQRLWHFKLPDVAADALPHVSVGDLDGDGVAELWAGLRQGGVWRSEVRDALTGALLPLGQGDAAVAPLRAMVRSGPSYAFALLGDGDGPGGGGVGTSAVVRWSRASGLTTLWQGKDVVVAGLPAAMASGPTTAALWRRSDADGDGIAENIEVFEVGGAAPTVIGQRAFGHEPVVVASGSGAGAARLAVSERDGALWWLNAALKGDNDSDGDGEADIQVGAHVPAVVMAAPRTVGGKDWRVVVAESGLVRIIDPAGADPLVPPAAATALRSGPQVTRATLGDLDGDGYRELVVRHTSAAGVPLLQAFGKGDVALWTYKHGDDGLRWSTYHGDAFALVDVDGDGGEDILASYAGAAAKTLGHRMMVRGATGAALWAADAAATQYIGNQLAVDTGTTPPTGLMSAFITRVRFDLATGALVDALDVKTSARDGYGVLAELDDVKGLDVVWSAATHALAAETSAFAPLWSDASKDYVERQLALAVLPTGPAVLARRGAADFRLFDARTGALLWSARYAGGKRQASDFDVGPVLYSAPVVVADLVGAGRPSALIAASDGTLYAIDATSGDVDWARSYGGVIGEPVPADIDGDGELEILLTTPSGHLEALDRDVLARVAWVRDNDGDGPALSEEDDVDEREDSGALYANWAAAPGADGYFVRVVDDRGGEIVPRRDVGDVTEAALLALALQPGRTYFVEVTAYTTGAGAAIEAQPQLSDGVLLVDVSPPKVTLLSATPPVAALAEAVTLRLEAHDATRLTMLRLLVRDPLGALVATFVRPVAARDAAIVEVVPEGDAALPPGTYQVEATVRDVADREVSATTSFRVCAAGEVATGGACALPTATTPPGRVPGREDPGCGCRAASGASPSAGAALLAAALAAALWWPRRRRR